MPLDQPRGPGDVPGGQRMADRVIGLVLLALRYRAGGQLLRQQVKWLVLTAMVFVAALLLVLIGTAAGHSGDWLVTTAYTVGEITTLFGIPAAMTITIPKHRLFDIDVVISRAVVYGLLSAAFTAIYAGVVVGIGTLVGAPRQRDTGDRRGRGDRAAVPAAAAPGAARREPDRARAAGHALSGAVRFRTGYGGPAGC